MPLGAITQEDRDLDRMLTEVAAQEPQISDNVAVQPLQKERTTNTFLSHLVADVKPAATFQDLTEQLHMAKECGADSVEADPTAVRHLTLKTGLPKEVGYFWYHDVKVWITGMAATHGKLLDQSIDERVFGKSRVTIANDVVPLGGKR